MKLFFLFLFFLISVVISNYYLFIRQPLKLYKNQVFLLQNTTQQLQRNQMHPIDPRELFKNKLTANDLMAITAQKAMHAGLHLFKLQVTTLPGPESLETCQVRLSAEGSFSQLIYFFQQLHRLPYFIVLKNWQITATTNQSRSLKLLIEAYHARI